jgi:hypothetical protein
MKRTVYVYLSSEGEAQEWRKKAKKSGVPLSQFVYEHVTNSLRQEAGDETYKPRAELIKQLQMKDETIERLTRQNEITTLALERVEAELRKYRAAPFLEDHFRGVRKYDKKLINLLRKGETVEPNDLLRLLGINPKETDLVKAIAKQLENLEAYGLVQKARRGWRWLPK